MARIRMRYLAVIAVLLSPVTANAVLIEISGYGDADGLWNVSTVQGTFAELQGRLETQVWWGNGALAQEFATLVGSTLELPNLGGGLGPAFAFADSGSEWVNSYFDASPYGLGITSFYASASTVLTFATQSRVLVDVIAIPEPGTLSLLGIGLLGLGFAYRRKQQA